MNLDRRTFLSFGIGAAAGIALTPLPWKVTDDLSIWTQNWPWTPVPAEGRVSYVNSTCTLCPGGCGITVRKVDNRVVKIEGQKGHPVNDGGICMLGLSGPQLLYTPIRIKSPMKRVNGELKALSWDEAISSLAEKLKGLESQKVACILGADRGTVAGLFKRFMDAYGSPNCLKPANADDAYKAALKAMQKSDSAPAYDLENADYVLSFGSGLIDGWGSPVRMIKANSAWQTKHVKVVQIESRLSNTAAKSSNWIPIIPGTEAALALGIAHVMIKNDLYNKAFVDSSCADFEALKKLVAECAPEKVSEITGVPSGEIEKLASDFAKAKNPIALFGRGQGSPAKVNEFMAIHALNALKGAVGQKGGICLRPEVKTAKWDKVNAGAAKEAVAGKQNTLNRFITALNAAETSPVELLMVAGANPLYSTADANAVAKAFEKIPFVVSFSSYMDETAASADLILPNHIYLERYEDVPTPTGIQKPVLGLVRPVLKPLYNTMHTGDVIIALAKKMGGAMAEAFAWDNYKTCLKESLADYWTELKAKGFWHDPAYNPLLDAKISLAKIEYAPVEAEGDANKYPLVLIPSESLQLASAYVGTTPFMMKTLEDTLLKKNDVFVEVNSKTASELGLREGKTATLSTPKASVNVKVHIFDGIMPGVIALPKGLGHTAYDDYVSGKGVNVNALLGTIEDKATGFDAAWGIRAGLSVA